MKAQFRILSGARAGQVDVLSKSEIVAGRHPSCDLRVHPEQDLDVSGKHATIVKSGAVWILRDLQSRNGTLLNGHRIHADTRIDDTDQIQLGAGGPKFEFRTVADSVPDTAPPDFSHAPTGGTHPRITGRHAQPGSAAPPAVMPVASSGGSTTQRIRIEVAKQTKQFKWMTLALAAILVLAVTGVYFVSQQQEQARERQVVALRARTDSAVQAADVAVRALQGQMAGLADALRLSQTQVQGLQTQLVSAQAAGDRTQIVELRKQLDDASNNLRNQQVAAQVDYRSIFAANQHCVALVYVRFADGVFTGTAFAVRPDGTMLTNRHVVAGEDGTKQALDVALKFTDSPQTFGARVLQISHETDLAVIRVKNLDGPIRTVCRLSQLADPVQPGDPVATIGFPLGTSLPMLTQGDKTIAKATFTAGTVGKVLPDQIQIDGYGAVGASGSPYFDGRGEVVGVLHAGEPGTNGRVVFAVPVSEAAKLLQTVN